MQEQSHQPSQIVFPVALHPVDVRDEDQPATDIEGWGWLEVFVLTQVL